jgi:hypothetical protein
VAGSKAEWKAESAVTSEPGSTAEVVDLVAEMVAAERAMAIGEGKAGKEGVTAAANSLQVVPVARVAGP